MTTTNRQIKTGHNIDQTLIVLIAKNATKFNGKSINKGEIIKCTKSEAKRILSLDKSSFEIKLD